MRASDQAIADRLRGMDLEQLRAEYLAVFGEEGRGGVEYLRRKIAHALIEAADRERQQAETETEEPSMSAEKRAEQLAIQAIDAENDGDWQGAAEKWAAASLATRTRKKEYQARAQACADKAPPPELEPEFEALAEEDDELLEEEPGNVPPEPERDPDAGPHLEHLEAANQAERDGDHRGAIVEWELAAGKAPAPLREGFLARAAQLRELLPPATGPAFTAPAASASFTTTGDPATDPQLGAKINAAAKELTRQTLERRAAVNTPPAAVNKPPTERDPRLPAPGTRLRKDLRDGQWVEVQFTDGVEVDLLGADDEHAALVGKRYASVSGLGRAYRGGNTNGYAWLGLKAPDAGAPATVAKAVAERTEKPRPTMEERALQVVSGEAHQVVDDTEVRTLPKLGTVARTPKQVIAAPPARELLTVELTLAELDALKDRAAMAPRPLLEDAGMLAVAMSGGHPSAELVQRMLHAEAARRVAAVYEELARSLEKV